MSIGLASRVHRLETEALRPVLVHGMVVTSGSDITGFTSWWRADEVPGQLERLRTWLTRPRPAHVVMFEQPAGKVGEGYELILASDVHPDAMQALRDRLAKYRAGRIGVFWEVML